MDPLAGMTRVEMPSLAREQARLVIGIDPGLEGYVVIIYPAGVLTFAKMPVIREKGRQSFYLVEEMASYLRPVSTVPFVVAALETTNPRPGHGVQASWLQSRGIALWEGILATLGIPRVMVRPQRWKRDLSMVVGEKDSRGRASELLPELAPFLTAKVHHNLADAALLAYWVRQFHGD